MSGDSASISMISLGEFNARLAARLAEADSVLASLQSDSVLSSGGGVATPPKLGTFDDAVQAERSYTALYGQYVQRLHRLHNAITAAKQATETITTNYRTTESLNAASANEITTALSGVPSALGDQS
jgi:hypothetical protein